MKKSRTTPFRVATFALLVAGLVASLITADELLMDSAYVDFFGIQPDSGATDADNDNLSNLQESLLWTDPFAADTDQDGFFDDADSNPVSRAFIPWGSPYFTHPDGTVLYTWPAWMQVAWAENGQWLTNIPYGWHSPAAETNAAALYMEVDRTGIESNLVLKVDFLDHTNSALYLDLFDTNDTVTASALYGNLLAGTGTETNRILEIPFAANPAATGIRLRKGAGQATILSSLLYVDADLDGLDADQEAQLGTSDFLADSDGDGLSDYDEVFIHGTDPANADTDGDGIGDGIELRMGLDPLVAGNYSTLPFSETFEPPAITTGELSGQNYWEVNIPGVAFVQTNEVFSGLQALKLANESEENGNPVIRHLFANAPAVVWMDIRQKVFAAPIPTNMTDTVGFFLFNGDGHLVVTDGNRPAGAQFVTLTNTPASVHGEWARITIRADYAAQSWFVWLNGILVADNLGFAVPQERFTAINIEGHVAVIDDIYIGPTQPAAISTVPGNQVPDEWYIQHFGALGADAEDPDADGLTNLQEYLAGTNPTNPDTDADGFSDGHEVSVGSDPLDPLSYPITLSGTITYTGSQTGTLHIASLSASGDRLLTLAVTGQGTAYSFTNLISRNQYTISAFLDTTADGIQRPWEPTGTYAGNPLLNPVADLQGIDITLSEDQQIDTDGDGMSDYAEVYTHGSNPSSYETTPDNTAVLTRQVWNNITGTAISQLTTNPRYPFLPDQQNQVTGLFEAPVNAADYYGQRILGRFHAPRTGNYTFWLASDDDGQLWINTNGTRQLIASVSGATSSRQWTKYASQQSAPIYLQAGQVYPIEALAKEHTGGDNLAVGIQFPDGRIERPMRARWFETPPAGIAADTDSDGDGLLDIEEWVCGSDPLNPETAGDGLTDYEKVLLGLDPTLADTDRDGMPDVWELQYALNPLNATDAALDPDADGLTNLQEYQFGTNPRLADSDSDGIIDGDEINIFRSNPLVADFDGTVTDLLSSAGSATTATGGSWATDGTSIHAQERNGWLDYTVDFPQAGIFALAFSVTQRNALTTQGLFDLTLYVDGLFCGRRQVTAPYGTTATAMFLLPELPAGQHTARLVWRNIKANTFLQVNSLTLRAYSGPDADENGIADWVESRLAALFDVETLPQESIVSPVCLEGTSEWIEQVAVIADYAPDGAAVQQPTVRTGIRDGWYADVHLSPTNDTLVAVSGQAESHDQDILVTWAPLNLFADHAYTNGLPVRTGSSLLLAALPQAFTNGTAQIAISLNGSTLTNAVMAADAAPLQYRFVNSGTYLVTAAFASGETLTNAALTVSAVHAAFPMSEIVTVAGTARTLAAPAIPTNIVLQADPALQLTAVPRAAGGTTLTVNNIYDNPLGIVARLGENGPVLDSTRVATVYGDRGTYWRVTETYPDGSRLVMVRLQLGNVPENIRVVLDIFVGGVVFLDGTRKLTLTAADFDDTGSATYYMIQGAAVTTSTCHRTAYYDGTTLIK